MRRRATLLLLNLALFLLRCVQEATLRRVAVDALMLVTAAVAALWIVSWVIKLSGGLG